jgi:hypothetical protein
LLAERSGPLRRTASGPPDALVPAPSDWDCNASLPVVLFRDAPVPGRPRVALVVPLLIRTNLCGPWLRVFLVQTSMLDSSDSRGSAGLASPKPGAWTCSLDVAHAPHRRLLPFALPSPRIRLALGSWSPSFTAGLRPLRPGLGRCGQDHRHLASGKPRNRRCTFSLFRPAWVRLALRRLQPNTALHLPGPLGPRLDWRPCWWQPSAAALLSVGELLLCGPRR